MINKSPKELANDLIEAAAHDTQVRIKLEQDGSLFEGYHPEMRKVHEANAITLANFIDLYGWPAPSKYGKKVHEAAWLIAIHAISKPDVLRNALRLLKAALDQNEQVATHYAKLFDRIALYEGRKQKYGTQFFPSATGTWHARDLEDPENVETRRAELGMISFARNQEQVDKWAATLPTVPPAIDEEKFLCFLIEVGWRNQKN